MAQSVEEVSAQLGEMVKQFVGFQKMLQSTMDSLDTIGTWQVIVDMAFDDLHEKARGTGTSLDAVTKRVELAVSHVDSIEAWLTTTVSPPPIHPSPPLGNLDLNAAPKSSSCSRAMDRERAKGMARTTTGSSDPGRRTRIRVHIRFPLPVNPLPLMRVCMQIFVLCLFLSWIFQSLMVIFRVHGVTSVRCSSGSMLCTIVEDEVCCPKFLRGCQDMALEDLAEGACG
jgi:hypothetical protein